MRSSKTAVIVGRFQVDKLHSGHRKLFEEAYLNYERVIVVICDAYRRSKTDPLTYAQRKTMVLQELDKLNYQNPHHTVSTNVHLLKDTACNKVWSTNLDELISKYDMLYDCEFITSRDSFLPYYSGGIKATNIVDPVMASYDESVSGTKSRERIGNMPLVTNHASRMNAIQLFQHSYPIIAPTVDIAVIRFDLQIEKTVLLLGRKKNSVKYCLPGGFVDSDDESFTHAAERELFEETGIIAATVGKLQFEDSFKLKDWRFKGKDTVITSLFILNITQLSDTIKKTAKANDDLEELMWIPLKELENFIDNIQENHKVLINRILNKYKYVKN